jgi:DNA gyrase subunit A
MERFEIDTVQSQAILDMRLARLTSLEIEKLMQEAKDLEFLIKNLAEIVRSEKKQLEIVKDEMLDIKKNFKSPRLTTIVKSFDEMTVETVDDSIPFRENYVVYDNSGIKAVSLVSYNATKKSKTNFTQADIEYIAVKATNEQDVFAFTDIGNVVRFNINLLPEGNMRDKKALSLKELCPEVLDGEKIVAFLTQDSDGEFAGAVYVFTANGMIKKTDFKEYDVGKPYYVGAVLKEGDYVTGVEIVREGSNIMFVTEEGMCLNAATDDVPTQGRRSGGVKGIQMSDSDKLLLMTQVSDAGEIIVITDKGYAKRVSMSEIDTMKRYRKGVKIADFGTFNGKSLIFASYVTEPAGVGVIHNEMTVSMIDSNDIKIEKRTAKGKPLLLDKSEIRGVRLYR